MSTQEQISEAIKTTAVAEDNQSRLSIIIRKSIDGKEIDNGHFGLICAHSTGIAFNLWGEKENKMIFKYNYGDFNENYNYIDFYMWRFGSFRKLILEASDKEFFNVKEKLIRDKIPFGICGEVFFGSNEVALVVFPLNKESTPKYIKFLKTWR